MHISAGFLRSRGFPKFWGRGTEYWSGGREREEKKKNRVKERKRERESEHLRPANKPVAEKQLEEK